MGGALEVEELVHLGHFGPGSDPELSGIDLFQDPDEPRAAMGIVGRAEVFSGRVLARRAEGGALWAEPLCEATLQPWSSVCPYVAFRETLRRGPTQHRDAPGPEQYLVFDGRSKVALAVPLEGGRSAAQATVRHFARAGDQLARARAYPAAAASFRKAIALEPEDAPARAGLAAALASSGEAAAALAELREAACRDPALALRRAKSDLAFDGLRAAPELARLLEALARDGPAMVQRCRAEKAGALVAQLRASDWSARASAALQLGRLKEETAVEALLGALDDPANDWRVLQPALSALGELRDRRALPRLTALVSAPGEGRFYDEKERARTVAAIALAVIDGPAATKLLAPHLASDDWRRRNRAAEALGKTGDPDAVAPLLAALEHSPPTEDGAFQELALQALGELAEPRAKALDEPLAVGALLSISSAIAPERRGAVLEVLQRFTGGGLRAPAMTAAAHRQSALHLAASRGIEAWVDALARRGADLDARDAEGLTPLMLAARGGQLGFVEKLLARGANPNVATSAGLTALDLATQQRHFEVARALRTADAGRP